MAIQQAAEAAGTIDVLVNNMGWGDPSLFLDTDPSRWDRMWRLNLGATIGCSHAALSLMRARRQGAIVSIASDAAQGVPNQAVYGAMKSGVVALTKALAKEFGRYGIRVRATPSRPVAALTMSSAMRCASARSHCASWR